MRQHVTPQELDEHFTVLPQEHTRLAQKSPAQRLGCAILLKYFQWEGRFPTAWHDVPHAVIRHVAARLGVPIDSARQYDLEGRLSRYHKEHIRQWMGVRPGTAADAEAIKAWVWAHTRIDEGAVPQLLQYDTMMQYATALRLGTADAQTILKRFTRSNYQHPTYRAIVELGKAVKTLFLCRFLHDEALRQEIHDGLQVIENWNSANEFIFYGRGGDMATNRLEDQEMAMLALHLLQISLVYINTLMVQQIFTDETWFERMTPEDFRALTPLTYAHINPYGTFELDMQQRLHLDAA
jgi:hypothetical protein